MTPSLADPIPVTSDHLNDDQSRSVAQADTEEQAITQAPLTMEPEDSAPPESAAASSSSIPTGPIDFATLDFASMSPQDLEQLYIASINQNTDKFVQSQAGMQAVRKNTRTQSIYAAPTMPSPSNGLSWDNHPNTMSVHLENIRLTKPVSNISVRFSFRHRKVKTNVAAYPDGLRETKHKFECNYHSLLFDYLKVDIYEGGFFGSHIGRAHIRLSRLPQVLGDIEHTYSLNHRKAHRSPKLAGKDIGEITVGFSFIGGRRSKRLDRSESIGSNPDASSSRSRSDSEYLGVHDMDTPEQRADAEEIMEFYKRAQVEHADEFGGSQFDETRSVISMRTTGSARSSTGSGKKKRRPTLISENTMLGLKELSELTSAFFGTGWKLTKPEIARSALFVQKYYMKYHPNPRTNDVVTDERQIRVACYFLNYAMASYGSLILNYFGYGKGYLRDALRLKMDSNTAREHLGLGKGDMLAWNFELELFKPQFYICRDPKLNAIVIVIRGTWNLHECVVDMCGDYEPFSHGYAHKGFLRCAQYLEVNYLDRIKAWVQQYKCSAVYLSAHSLGAGVASLFTMILQSHIPEFRTMSGNPRFKLKCYNIATPPCVNAELCKEFEPYIETYVNENDLVPRASWGAVCDFRDLIITAHGLLNDKKLSTQERMDRLAEHHTNLKDSNEHPKVYIPGKIFYIYKTSRVHSASTKRPPKQDEIDGDAFTGNPLVDDITPHYLVERSSKELFCNIQFKTNFLWHHLPNKYDAGLRKAHDYLQENRPKLQQ
ncbi:hypothetical protein HDU88_005613 [Geranomyces variabilis]|nr:hypothetical protein HDU88_005613 [Geranomyces variabilis]